MAYAYWRAGRHREPAVFELFFRDNPFGGGFSLFAGLTDCLLFLRGFRFTEPDVEFLRSVLPPNTDPAYFHFLRSLDCSAVTLRSVAEGTVVFAREPLMEVEGPLAVVQLLETSLLCLVNYASLCLFKRAMALCELGYRPVGIRLDSGDLCRQSVDVRQVFRRCSEQFSIPAFNSLIIVGTNNISEQSISELNKKENEIDVVGVGTHLVTCTKQPSLGCVYKLVEVRGRPRMKISEDPKKSTVPGRKAVYRMMDSEGHPFLDLLCLKMEPPPEAGCPLTCYPLENGNSPASVTPAQVICLRQEVFSEGQITQPLCSAAESRAKVQSSLQALHPRHKRLQEPDSYTVALSEKLHNLVSELQKDSSSENNFLLAN
uniref:nicotinate phosphoribosyltransferase n=1 Tax=Nothobranchius rachovii TaxID=451742 RepID=A0A1A8RIH1_9TELE